MRLRIRLQGPMPTSARQYMPLFTKIFGEFATSLGADVGIGPYNQWGGAYGFA